MKEVKVKGSEAKSVSRKIAALYAIAFTILLFSYWAILVELSFDPALQLQVGLVGGFSFLIISTTLLYMTARYYLGGIQRSSRALADSEEKFRALADTALDAIISSDGEGKITFWNRAAERLLGYSPGEVIGRPITIIIPDSYKATVGKVIASALSGAGPEMMKLRESKVLRKDGTEVPVELSASVSRLQGGPFATAIIRDISQRKKAEEELKKYS